MQISDKNYYRKKPRKLVPEDCNIHKSLRFLLVIAQVFGFFPIQGVLSSKPNSTGFTWLSLKILSAVFTTFGGFLVALGHITHMLLNGYDQFEMNGAVFYICGSLSCIFFVKLATEWRSILSKWTEVDTILTSYGWPKNLNRKLKCISIIFLVLETAEHLSIQANKIIVSIHCKGSLSKGFEHFFVNMSFPVIFNVIKPFYSPWLGLIFQIVNTRMAFSWTFIDIFIMLISCSLAMRFQQINNRISCLKNMKVLSGKSWISINVEYNQLCNLCALLDDKMSFLILISFFNNFYFIIFQVYDSLSLYRYTVLETAYYFISLILLLSRITSVCLYASWINEETQKSLDLLTNLPYEIQNKEIARFVENVKYQKVGFTGKQFFKISKSLILKIASAVVTYELVVIQFNRNMKKLTEPSKNSIC